MNNAFAARIFPALKTFLHDHQQTLLNGVLVLVTICAESIFQLTSWDCPAIQPASRNYGICFIAGPAIILLALGLLVNSLTWRIFHGCCCRDHHHGCSDTTTGFFTLIMKSIISPTAWLFLIFLHGNYYVCIRSSEPCKADSDENKYFKAESQIISWCILTGVITIATLGLIIFRCCSKLSYLQNQLRIVYQDEEAQVLENTMKEKAKEQATVNVQHFFEKNPLSHEDWDCVSMVPPHSVNREEPEKSSYTSIERWWSKNDCKQPTPRPQGRGAQ